MPRAHARDDQLRIGRVMRAMIHGLGRSDSDLPDAFFHDVLEVLDIDHQAHLRLNLPQQSRKGSTQLVQSFFWTMVWLASSWQQRSASSSSCLPLDRHAAVIVA